MKDTPAMSIFIALLRAVNVGGSGRLPMTELKTLCKAAGFTKVQTYIASGNVVFETTQSRKDAGAALACRLESYAGKAVGVMLRTPDEMRAILKANPFPDAAPNRVLVFFFDQPLPPAVLNDVKGQKDEEIIVATKEIYVHYNAGMARSKLVIPATKTGTGRNINTVARLLEMATTP